MSETHSWFHCHYLLFEAQVHRIETNCCVNSSFSLKKIQLSYRHQLEDFDCFIHTHFSNFTSNKNYGWLCTHKAGPLICIFGDTLIPILMTLLFVLCIFVYFFAAFMSITSLLGTSRGHKKWVGTSPPSQCLCMQQYGMGPVGPQMEASTK